jgi:serine/threonine-protein kinase
VPVPVAAAIACHTLAGLHAAHETVDELGTPLHIVHRDVSPQNIIVGDDGTVRLLDFGIAKAASTGHITRRGVFKGKLGYTSPEQLRGEATRHSDVYSLGVVLWEMLVGERLHGPQGEAQLVADIMAGQLPTITEALANDRAWIGSYRWNQLEALEPIVRKALDREPRRRWQSAAEMEEALAAAVPIASPNDIAAWLRAVAKDFLELREKLIAEEEASWRRSAGAAAPLPCDHPVASGPATEPELVRALPWRGPTLLLAVLVVVVTATFAFLLRDLKSPKPHRVPAAIVEPMPVAAPVVPPVTTAVSVEHEARVEPPPAVETPPAEPIKPARPKRAAAKPPPARPAPPPPRAAPPPPPTPPPAEKSASVDCTTPFYFEGNKKIFKPGCL